MLNNISNRSKADLSMLFVAFIWGVTFVLVKNALADIGPFLFLGIRFIIAFLVLAALSMNNMKQVKKSTIVTGSILGFFLFIGYIFQTVGLQYTSASNAGFITGLSVVLVPIIYAILNKRAPSLLTIFTVIIASIGLFLLSVQNTAFHLLYGDFLILICAFGFAFHIVFVARYSHKHNPLAITGVQILFVGLLCIIIGLIIEPWPSTFTYNVVIAILITSVLATSLAFLLQNALQKYSTPTRFAIVLVSEPVFAALAGYFWAGEVLSKQGMFGCALIIIAMILAIAVRITRVKINIKNE